MSESKEQIKGFLGSLEQDSPSAHSLVTRYFGTEAFNRLDQTYASVIEASAAIESKIIRTAGVRFNPLPARILYILVAEARCRDLEVIDQALKACGNSHFYSLSAVSALHKEHYLQSPYLAAFVLDLFRHLHMSEEDKEANFPANLNAILRLSENGAFSFWPRIDSLISAAAKRSQRLIKV